MEQPWSLMAVAQLDLGNSSPKMRVLRLNAVLIHNLESRGAMEGAIHPGVPRAPSDPSVPILGVIDPHPCQEVAT